MQFPRTFTGRNPFLPGVEYFFSYLFLYFDKEMGFSGFIPK